MRSFILAIFFNVVGMACAYELGWRNHKIHAAHAMTRDDVECDWPSRTIKIKPGHYTPSLVLDICGWPSWPLEGIGTIYIDGGGSTIKVQMEPAR